MTTIATRARRLAAGLAGVIIAALAIGAGGATATAAEPMPTGPFTLEIHKFEQPEQLGQPANGLPQDTATLTAVAGATFTAKLVPGIDLATNAGQQQAGALTPADAAALVGDETITGQATTDSVGNATIEGLGMGLYYVQETVVPEGYAGAAPFLVALPLTHPQNLDSWLTTVHIYPKNAKAAISLDVIDQESVVLGDPVHWVSRSDIPNQPVIDGYRIEQKIDPKLELIGSGGDLADRVEVTIEGAGQIGLTPGIDYTIGYDPGTRTMTIDFTESGLHKLEAAVGSNPGAQVRVDYDTTVLAEGVLVNEAVLYPSRDAIEQGLGVSDTAVTKWGPLSILVHENGNPSNVIAGACFMLYLSEEDARAGRNPIVVDGVGEWVTDASGRFVVNGLRFSDFVNGLDREADDPLYRLYWAAPTCTPPGWTWVDQNPLAGVVNDVLEYQTLIFKLEKKEDIPITGGQMAGIGMLAALLIGGGAVALLARRRKRDGGVE